MVLHSKVLYSSIGRTLEAAFFSFWGLNHYPLCIYKKKKKKKNKAVCTLYHSCSMIEFSLNEQGHTYTSAGRGYPGTQVLASPTWYSRVGVHFVIRLAGTRVPASPFKGVPGSWNVGLLPALVSTPGLWMYYHSESYHCLDGDHLPYLPYIALRVIALTEKKDGAKTVPFGNRFEKWCP